MGGLTLYAGVFLAALGESTALVGLLVPGVGIVVAASVLAARGEGSLIGVALAASAGSVVGFGLSYHLGKAGGKRLSAWSLRAHAAIEKAQTFLDRFGGWAVFWGHFFGPVRACVALVAGAGRLPPGRFWLASVSGAFAWGFGLAAGGAGLSGGWRVVEGVLGRGSLLVAGAITALYVSLRLSAGTLALGVRVLVPALNAVLDLLSRLGNLPGLGALAPGHPQLLAWLRRRLSPDRATGLLLSGGAAICLCFAGLFFGVAEGVLFHDPLVQLDLNLFHLLESLRNPGGVRFFLWITYLGSGPVLAASATAGVCALWMLRRRFDAGLLAIGFGSGELLMWTLKHLFARPRPAPTVLVVPEVSPAFPSNHAFSSIALFGFLAYLFTRRLPPPARARLFAWTGVAVVAVGMSRLYLGAHWASDVAAGYALGGIWLSALVTGAEARRRFGPPSPAGSEKHALVWGSVVLGIVLAVWGAMALQRTSVDLARRGSLPPVRRATPTQLLPDLLRLSVSPVETLTGDPLGRISLFVFSDDPTLRRAAQRGRWSAAVDLDLMSLTTRWAQAWRGSKASTAPVYPRFWLGRPHELSFVLAAGNGGRWVARCWETGLAADDGRPLWAVWLRNELPPRRLFGIPVPSRRAGAQVQTGLFSTPLVASGEFYRVSLPGSVPFELLESVKPEGI